VARKSEVTSPHDFHEYLIKFHSDVWSEDIIAEHEKPKQAKAINDVKLLWIRLKFLPLDSEILGGTVVVTINSNVRSVFNIPPQNNFSPTNHLDLEAFEIIATNVDQTTMK
jgi:hypothetical protein